MASEFDESRLDDPAILAESDHLLRPLAEAGARLRRESAAAEAAIASLAGEQRPRAVIAVGPEARLLRAVLEPVCPVPFVAWPNLGLPGWVGPLDLVVVLGGGQAAATCAHEALRRGSRLLVTAPEDSSLARQAESRATTLLPVSTADPMPAAIVALAALHEMGLGAPISPAAVADALDAVALESAHGVDIAANPAKMVALELADSQPVVWAGPCSPPGRPAGSPRPYARRPVGWPWPPTRPSCCRSWPPSPRATRSPTRSRRPRTRAPRSWWSTTAWATPSTPSSAARWRRTPG